MPIGQIVARARAVRWRDNAILSVAGFQRAWAMLTGASIQPRPLLGLLDRRAARRVLTDIRDYHPLLEADLDPAAVAAVEASAGRVRQARLLLIRVLVVAPMLALVIAEILFEATDHAFVRLYPPVALLVAVVTLWGRRMPVRTGIVEPAATGAFGLLFLSAVAAVLMPASPVTTLAWGAIAAIATIFTTDPEADDRQPAEHVIDRLRRAAWPLLAQIALAWSLDGWPAPVWLQAALPMAALGWSAVAMRDRIVGWLGARPPAIAQGARALVVALSAGLIVWWLVAFDGGHAPLAAYAAAGLLLIAQHLLSPATADPGRSVNRLLLIPFLIAIRFGAPGIVALATLFFLRTFRRPA